MSPLCSNEATDAAPVKSLIPRNHLEAIIMNSLITSNLNTRLRKQHMQNNWHTAKYRAQWAETNQACNRKTKKRELFNISTLVIKHKMTEPRQYVHMQTSRYSKLNSLHDIVLWKTQPHLATNHLKWQILWQTFFTHKQNPSSTESHPLLQLHFWAIQGTGSAYRTCLISLKSAIT